MKLEIAAEDIDFLKGFEKMRVFGMIVLQGYCNDDHGRVKRQSQSERLFGKTLRTSRQ